MVHRAELFHAQHFSTFYQREQASSSALHGVEHFWLLKSYQALGDAVSESHFPRLNTEWVFSLNRAPDEEVNRPAGFFTAVRPPLRRLTPFVYGSHTVAFGVRFKAGQAPEMSDLSALYPEIEALLARCQSDTSPRTLAQLSQVFQSFLENHGVQDVPTERVRMCQQALVAFEDPNATVDTVASHLGLSPRTLRRYFQSLWGMSPKQVQRQVRLREALKYRWSPDAYQGEFLRYYGDQAHFYKSFRQVCQVSLQQFLQLHRG